MAIRLPKPLTDKDHEVVAVIDCFNQTEIDRLHADIRTPDRAEAVINPEIIHLIKAVNRLPRCASLRGLPGQHQTDRNRPRPRTRNGFVSLITTDEGIADIHGLYQMWLDEFEGVHDRLESRIGLSIGSELITVKEYLHFAAPGALYHQLKKDTRGRILTTMYTLSWRSLPETRRPDIIKSLIRATTRFLNTLDVSATTGK